MEREDHGESVSGFTEARVVARWWGAVMKKRWRKR
jgi:hypothetical protein